jgi:acyl dehydratase
MTAMQTFRHEVSAFNVSHASENKIHDDTVAKKLGFTGGLVPGVEVFAYATNPVVARWGRNWLERGRMDARFAKPVYDGRIAVATGTDLGEHLDLRVESDGELCATGVASLPSRVPTSPDLTAWPEVPRPSLAGRPPADETSLAEGRVLATASAVLTPERHAEYLRDVRETHALYAAEGIAHPGILLRLCNSLLRENVVLAPWIHVGSNLQNFRPARVGETLAARGKVVRNYDRKGHRLVDLDCVLTADGKLVAHVLHTAIYRLRHLSGA